MKSKPSRKKNRRTKRQQKSLQFESLEPRQMLTFFTPGPSDPALFDNVVNVTADSGDVTFERFGSLSENSQINLTDGGRIGIDDFSSAILQADILNTEINISGGIVGNEFQISGGELNVSGGVIGPGLDILAGPHNISGGVIGNGFRSISGDLTISGGVIGSTLISTGSVHISGGTIGSLSTINQPVVNVSGGVIGDGTGSFSVTGNLNISGGDFQNRLRVGSESEVNLFVLDYQIDGQSPDSQAIGEIVTIADRDVTISGTLADGTPFSFGLNTGLVAFSEDAFASDATLNVMLVDETGVPNEPAVITGDLNASVLSDGFTLETSGQLNVIDSDLGAENRIIQQLITEGNFGNFSLLRDGRWTYTIDTAAVSSLLVNESVSDSFEVVAADGTTETVTITINGVQLPPPTQDSTITGDFSGAGLATDSTITGTVSVTDPDVGLPFEILDTASGAETSTSLTVSDRFYNLYRFEITERTQINEVGAFFRTAGNPTLFAAINRLTSIEDLPDSVDLTGDDLVFRTEFSLPPGSQVTLAPVSGLTLEPGAYSLAFGLEEPSSSLVSLRNFERVEESRSQSFSIDQLEGNFTSISTLPISGTTRFIINGQQDPPNVSEVVPQSGIQGNFGVFNIEANGNYEYVIDTAAVESLILGESVSENFQIVSVDGTATETITVTINGVNQPVTASDTTLEVREDAINGATLGTVIASDPDGNAPEISIVSGNEAGVFAVDTAGNVTLADASQLDFDTTSEFVLVFEASDGLTTDTATLTIGVVNVNQAAVIVGDISGNATEDRGVSGLLTITDADGADEAAFQAEFIRGTFGQIGIQADGNWRYTPFTTPVTQAIRAGETVSDTFTLTSVDGTTVDITILIEGVNDPATFPGTAPVQISEDATAPLTGQINVVDRDAAESEIIPSRQTGSFGIFEINAAGEYSYTVDNATAQAGRAGFELDDFFVITSLDGTEQDFLVQVIGVNDNATITGDFTGTIDEDAVNPIRGTLEISDPDFSESRANENPIVVLGNFGTFQYSITGSWFYTVDNDAVADLNSTESVTDTFEVVSFDGTATALVTITIEGRNDHFDDLVSTDSGTPVTFNAFDNDQVTGSVIITSTLAAQGGDILIGVDGNVTYTPSENANLNGTDSFALTFEDENGNTAVSNVVIDIAPPVIDSLIFGTTEDDILEGNDLDNVLIGDTGSDVLIGSRGNDIFVTDAINGDNGRFDQDVIRLGNVDGNDTGNDVITDFDVNRNNRSENNFDSLEFTFNGVNFTLSSRNDFRNFVRLIETDGDINTDAILDGSDLIFVFGRDSGDPSIITSSIRLEDVLGQNGLSLSRLQSDSVDIIGTAELDVFFASGAVEIGSNAGEALSGSAANDVIVGGLGSDVLFGGAGNDTLTGDQTDGANFGQDQDTFELSQIASGNIGNDVITDFDVNNLNGGEQNFDRLTLTLGGQDFSLSTGQEFLDFAAFIDSDGNDNTGTLIDGDDIIFVFGRNSQGIITDSIRLKDVIGDDGLTDSALAAFNRLGESGQVDVFAV